MCPINVIICLAPCFVYRQSYLRWWICVHSVRKYEDQGQLGSCTANALAGALEFLETYNKEFIKNLKKEDYFPGLGKKDGCIAYDLEWRTRKLGSIKGGSKYKFGYEVDFPKIKLLIQNIISINSKNVYKNDGGYLKDIETIVALSKEINGFRTGRTVVPKLLSIYYPNIFLPIFNDQDHFLYKILNSGFESERTGLDLYLEYNYCLLKIKDRLEEKANRKFGNYEYEYLLYDVFPKEQDVAEEEIIAEKSEEEFEAPEENCQNLLHKNLHRLFKNLKYFDEEAQNSKKGHYDTQTVGTMDMLCIDEKKDFVVIEIKRQASDETIGQILRYMGWTKEELCKKGQKVKGIIVGERKDSIIFVNLNSNILINYFPTGV